MGVGAERGIGCVEGHRDRRVRAQVQVEWLVRRSEHQNQIDPFIVKGTELVLSKIEMGIILAQQSRLRGVRLKDQST